MAEKTENAAGPIVIKKYANRRLYNTATSTYVTLDHLAQMVRDGQDFVVNDAKSGDDITRGVLAQIIFEEEAKGQTMLPANFLRQLIRLYGDTLQGFVPGYLEASMETFSRNQEAMREQVRQAFEANPALANFEALARSNMEWFENAMRMFAPFATGMAPKPGVLTGGLTGKPPKKDVELEELKEQLAAMQAQLVEAASRRTEAQERRSGGVSAPGRSGQLGPDRRPAVEIALQAVDAQAAQPVGVGLVLDPLGDGHHLEVARHRGQAFDQHLGVAGLVHAFDEAAVDLDHVEAEVAEVPEPGRPGAEVVEREGAAGGADVVHEVDGLVDVLHRRGLGDLEDQPAADARCRRGPRRRGSSSHSSSPIDSGDMLTDSRSPGLAPRTLSAWASASRSIARPSGPVSTAGMKAPAGSTSPVAAAQSRERLEEGRQAAGCAPAPPAGSGTSIRPWASACATPNRSRALASTRRPCRAAGEVSSELEGVDRGKLVHGRRPFRLAADGLT